MTDKAEEKDESFEIISVKEALWRKHFAEAEDSLLKSEANVLINKAILKIAEEELKKEQKKNAP